MRRLVALAVAGVLSLFLAVQYVLALGPAVKRERASACATLEPTESSPLLGKLPVVAPDVQGTFYDGRALKLSDFKGKVVFLNFWATWCPPCVEEMPSLKRLAQAFAGEPFAIFAPASESGWDKVRSFFPDGTPLNVVLDSPVSADSNVGAAAARYGTEKLPETYLIDKQGSIRYYFVNKRDWSSPRARQCVRSLLDE